MGMIYACPRNHDSSLIVPKAHGMTFTIEGEPIEFVPIYCRQCGTIELIDKTSIKQDGDIWRYE